MVENLFGTDGIRGTIGQPPFSLELLVRLGKALGIWAQHKYGKSPKILLGHDTRTSCHFVKSALQSGLLLYPVTIYDTQVLPTPTLCQLTQHSKTFDCSIIISASHNPYQDNGIKIIDQKHGKLHLDDELTISSLFYQQSMHHGSYTDLGTVIMWDEAQQQYAAFLSSFFKPNFLAGKTIVLDCANGATVDVAPRIFQEFGAKTIVIHNNPNGKNINHQCGALHLQDLQQAVLTHRADIGFAFDGDGDRVMAVNKYGHIKNGDDILALLLAHPDYTNTRAIVGTIMTNHGFAAFLASRNKALIRANVGDKHVAEQLTKEHLIIGGEQSGHIIMRDYLDTGDGIFTALRLIEALYYADNWDMITFEQYPQILINIPVAVKKDLALPHLASIIAMGNAQLPSGRLVVRYSGTENLLRIMIEDHELHHAQQIGSLLSQALQKELSTP